MHNDNLGPANTRPVPIQNHSMAHVTAAQFSGYLRLGFAAPDQQFHRLPFELLTVDSMAPFF
jgi:hypothetical protein